MNHLVDQESSARAICPGIGDVDAAVRSVLTGLLGTPRSFPGPAPSGPPRHNLFAGRLLALKDAEALSGGPVEVLVAPGTVVTPLARDHLKRVGISIRLISRAEIDRNHHAGDWAFAVETERYAGLIAAVRRSWLEGQDAWSELPPTLDDAAGWVAGSENRGALLLTDEASVAVYRACLRPRVRAATACEPEAVFRAVRNLGANLLVVEPAGKSVAWLRQIGQTFRRAGGPVAPAWWAEGRTG